MTKNQPHSHILTYFCKKKIVDSNHHAILDFCIKKNIDLLFEIGLKSILILFLYNEAFFEFR